MAPGAELEPIADGIWLVPGEIVDFYGFPYPTRSVIVLLASGDLWVWSPVRLTPGLKDAVAALGRVAHLVSPNKLHHLYLGEWKDAFPGAKLWGPASTIRKRKDLDFQPALGEKPPAAWGGEIDQAWFRGSFLLDEILFFHRPSRTAIIADLSENFSPAFLAAHWRPWQRLLARLWRITTGYGYPPLEVRLSWIGRAPARRALAKVVSWQPVRVVMAHGEWQREGGAAYIERAFSWLRRR